MSPIRSVVKFCVAALGHGRSSIRGAAIGMIVAPVVAVLAFPVPLMVLLASDGTFHYSNSEDPATIVMILAATFIAAATVTIVFGLPVWAGLRILRRENGFLYCIAGAISGLVPPYLLLYAGADGPLPSPAELPVYIFSSAAGLLAAFAFWLIARDDS